MAALCKCSEEVFMYTDVSNGICVEECARTDYVLVKNKESKIMMKKGGGKKPCSYKKVTAAKNIDSSMMDMMNDYAKLSITQSDASTPLPNPRRAEWMNPSSLELPANFVCARTKWFANALSKLLEGGVSHVNRNDLIWYINAHSVQSADLIEKTTQKIKEIDTFLLKTLNSILVDFPRNPSHSYIYEMVQFFEKYTFTPKKYLNDILEKIHSKEGKKYTIMFYKWSKGFHKYLMKNGLCYVPPVFINNTFDKELVMHTPEIQVCEPKKGFEMPPLILEEGNGNRRSDDDELFESDDDDAKSSGSNASDDDAAQSVPSAEEMSDYDKSDSESDSESESEEYEEEQPSKAVKD